MIAGILIECDCGIPVNCLMANARSAGQVLKQPLLPGGPSRFIVRIVIWRLQINFKYGLGFKKWLIFAIMHGCKLNLCGGCLKDILIKKEPRGFLW